MCPSTTLGDQVSISYVEATPGAMANKGPLEPVDCTIVPSTLEAAINDLRQLIAAWPDCNDVRQLRRSLHTLLRLLDEGGD